MTAAPPVPAPRGPTAKASKTLARTNAPSSTDPSSPAAEESSRSDGGPTRTFLGVLQGIITGIGSPAKPVSPPDAESSAQEDGTEADREDVHQYGESDAVNSTESDLVSAEIAMGASATILAAHGPHTGETLSDQLRLSVVPGAVTTASGTPSTGVAGSPGTSLAALGTQDQKSTGGLATESSIMTELGDPNRTVASETAFALEGMPGSALRSDAAGMATENGSAFSHQGNAQDSLPRDPRPSPAAAGQISAQIDPSALPPGSSTETPDGMLAAGSPFGGVLHSSMAVGSDSALLEATAPANGDPTAAGNAGATGLAPSSTTPMAVASASLPPGLADLPPGHFGAPPEVARSVPSQILPLLGRLPQNGATLVLRLDPPALGTVVLRVVASEGRRVRLHFQVEDPAVGSALADGREKLETALRAQGLLPDGFTVALDNGRQNPHGQPGEGSSWPRHETRPRRQIGDASALDRTTANPEAIDARGSGRYIDYRL